MMLKQALMPSIAIATYQLRQHGGMERYVLDLINGFTQLGQDLTVYAAKADEHLPQYHLVNMVPINQKRIVKKIRPFFFSRQVDKVRLRDVPLIACSPCHHAELLVCGWTHGGNVRAKGTHANLIEQLNIYLDKMACCTAHRIVAHSHLIRQELIELYGVAPDKIEVVYPPVDTNYFFPNFQAAAPLRQQYGFAEHETIFLFPSMGHKRKGLNQLAAFFEHSDLPIKLAVAGAPLPRPMNNVLELGFCTNMPDLYRAADFTIMASQYEPFGLVGIESVLCGTRVLLSDNMACTEVLQPEAGWFFKHDDVDDLARVIHCAMALKQSGQHKIEQPLAMVKYCPTLPHHINQLNRILTQSSVQAA